MSERVKHKLCVDCAYHYSQRASRFFPDLYHICTYLTDIVTGDIRPLPCDSNRWYNGCGQEAKWFKEKSNGNT
jgi:hypothetical protein